ncbi:MAG: hypothetical protein RBS56_02140 [Candidatus Gracilibacteria bacterium]|jgi:hypothetical protein|nr:hypothetical protein [Candidatus Gracilibacteria bacterium]
MFKENRIIMNNPEDMGSHEVAPVTGEEITSESKHLKEKAAALTSEELEGDLEKAEERLAKAQASFRKLK